MENEENESVNNLEVAEQEEVVESTTTEIEEETLDNKAEEQKGEGENQEDSEETVKDTTEEKAKQSSEDNKYARQARLRAEKEAEARIEQAKKEAYEKGLAQGKVQSYIGRQNPYTGETIKDDYDVQEYLEMYELDIKGKDPVSGYRELQKEKARKEAEEKIKKDEEDKQNKWYQNDTKDFIEKYSSEKLQELTNDADFNLFANGKIGKMPLADIYEDYKKLISKYEKKSVETAKQIVANNSATPGALEEGKPQELNWETMSKEQFDKYLEKAKNGELR